MILNQGVTYAEAVQFLFQLRLFGANFGLENPRRLAALAGNPQHKLRFVHVAGTNGKGSTCAMLESIYRANGLKVGLFTSPHLVSFSERIQVDRQPTSEADVARLVEFIQPFLREFPADKHPTFFEVVTVMALRYFAEQQCDLVIWETGLGGRLDATNIVTPLASVITNIAFDHRQWLGDTLAKIASEKAGIIKRGVPVITSCDAPEALAVIRETAESLNATLRIVTGDDANSCELEAISLPLPGAHQRRNAALAIAVVRALESKISVSDQSIRQGLEQVHWPGRFQVIRRGRQTIVVDGAHNPAGVTALCDALKMQFPNREPLLILGALGDKDWKTMCATFARTSTRLTIVPVNNERGARVPNLVAACRSANPSASVAEFPCLKDALAATISEKFIVIAGSLYLVGEALELLEVPPTDGPSERALNERLQAPR